MGRRPEAVRGFPHPPAAPPGRAAAAASRRAGTIRKRNRPAPSGPVQDMLPWFEEQQGAAEMNHYGAMARRHWARWLPGRYATIENPERFFADLGERASDRIAALAGARGGRPPGEGYLERVGRLGQARHQAEEIVLHEMILLEPEPGAGPGPARG